MASFRQQLASAVPQLKDRTIAARDRLHQLQGLHEDQSDEELLGPLRTDQVFLTNLSAEVVATIAGWQNFIAKEPDRVDQEQLMATFPVYWDELDTPADQHDQQWPVMKLVGRARTLASTIEGFLAARADQALRSLPNSQSRLGSRSGTPFSQQTVNGSSRHESNFFNVDPTSNAQRGPLDSHLSRNSPLFGFGQPIRHSTPFGVPTTTAASFTPTTTRPTTQPTVTFATTQAGPHLSNGHQMVSAFVPVTQSNWANLRLPYTKQPAFSAPTNHNQGFIGQPKPFLRQAPMAPPVTTYIKPLRIEPPTFDGNPREWATFWAAFDLAVNSQPITDFEKHLLLRQYLKKDSPAYKAIEGLPPSGDTYDRAIGMLADRYGHPGRLEDELHAELLRLPQVQHHTCQALRPFYEKVEQICTQLSQTRSSADLAGDRVIYHLIKSKLPRETLIKLADMESRQFDSFTATGLRLALGKIVAELEGVEKYINTFQRSDQRRDSSTHPPRDEKRHERWDSRRLDGIKRQFPDHSVHPRHEDTRTFHVATSTTPPPQDGQFKHHSRMATPTPHYQQSKERPIFPCSLCDGSDHRPSNCPHYSTPGKRHKRLLEQKRCFICLRQNHLSPDCPYKDRRCVCCHQTGHHQLLCRHRNNSGEVPRSPTPFNKPPNFTGGNAQPMGTNKPPAFQPTHTFTAFQAEPPNIPTPRPPANNSEPPVRKRRKKLQAVLMTRTVTAFSSEFPDRKALCNVLFDPGSENSYITTEMVKRLRPEQSGTDFLELHVFGNNPPSEIRSPTCMVNLLQANGEWREFELNVVDTISTPMPIQQWTTPPLLNQPSSVMAPLNLLLGTRDFWSLIISNTPIPEDPTLSLVQTVFGPVIGGETDSPEHIDDTMAFCAFPSIERPPTTPESSSPIEQKRGRQKKVPFNPSTTLLLVAFACLLTPVFTAWPFAQQSAEHHTSKCHDCYLNCTKRGVTISAPSHIQKMEVCCLQDCRSRVSSTPFTFELPEDVLVIDHNCEAFFWESASKQFHSTTTCPAIDSCELFDCWFCTDHLQNPTCNKQWATVLYLALTGTSLLILGCLFSIFLSVRAAARFLRGMITAFLCLPLRFIFWAIGRPWTPHDEQKMAQRVRSTSRRAAHTVRRSVRIARTRLRQMTAGSFMAALMLNTIAMANGDTISIISHSESCKRGELGIECTITTATTLTLLPAGQTNTLLVRDEHGIVLATFTLRLISLTLDCHPKTEAWLRSYTMDSLAVKRCPRAGSCRGDYCSLVRPETPIAELKSVNDIPGNSFCLDSTSFWGNDCGLPAAACLFYRTFIRPTSSDPFELFSCPGWSTRLIVQLILEANNGQRQSAKLALHPGLSSKWGNLTLTPLAVSLPPMPVLDSKFITDGRSVTIIDQIPLDLACPTREDARLLNCTIATSACSECFPNHSDGTVDCSCRHLNLDDLLASPESRLPLDIAKLHLRNEEASVFAQHAYSPVQLHVKMHNLSLTMEFKDSKCWVTPHKLVGCYKCSTGAQLHFTCRSDHGTPLAKIECADGTLFVGHCSVNGTTNTIVLPFDHYAIDTECIVDCPAGETHFHLNGTLYFIPLRNRFSTHQHTSGRVTPDPDSNRPWFDFSNPWAMLLAHFYPLLALAFLGLILLRFLPMIIRQLPIFRAYRLLSHIAILFCLMGPSLAQPTPIPNTILLKSIVEQI